MEAGFDLARSENKPVYLYWGAVWCPPCQEIKHTVFKSQQFIAQMQLFVPIYLDGDTDRAQAWGEKFGVKGYPTMIIFNPEGEEVTRIPGGIELSRYNSVLALSLNQMRPTSMLVDLALNDPQQLQPGDFVQLAYYSWGQDAGSLPEGTPATFFSDLSERSSDREASARLYMEHLVTLVREREAGELDSQETDSTGAFERLSAILDSAELTLACWDSLGYYAAEITALPIFSAEELAELKNKWQMQFQWGASYVRAIVRLTPENHDLIISTSMNLFDDLQGEQEVFAGRNFRILRALNKQLAQWQDDQQLEALVETFHSRIQSMCEKQATATLELENCQSLLSS